MRIEVEFNDSLVAYLPTDAEQHRAGVEVAEGSSVNAVLDYLAVPREKAHLVLLNGVFLRRRDRDWIELQDGDVIAVWPPAGGE
jgi:sulfur carrier protein ThiS